MATITVRFSVPGFHRWPDARKRREYLSMRHRHLFGFAVTIPVFHDDREIEFHDLIAMAKAELSQFEADFFGIREFDRAYEFGDLGCEGIADFLSSALSGSLKRWCRVEVSEDGECSATVKKKPAEAGRKGGMTV